MKMKRILALGLTSIMLFASGCGLIEKTPEAKLRETVAKVNGEKITRAEFDKRQALEVAQIKAMYGEEALQQKEIKDYIEGRKAEVLESMISETLILQKAKELKAIPDSNKLSQEIAKRYQEAETSSGGTEKFNELLKNIGISVDEYKELIRKEIIYNELFELLTKDVKVTDEEVTTYYHTNIYDYTEKPNKMKVSHILVGTEDEAKKIKDEIDKGLSFADAAKKYGTDGTKDEGGSLGEVFYSNKDNVNSYDMQFLTACIKAESGKVTGPIKTQFGFHLILVTDKVEYPAKSLDSVKDQIKDTLLEEKKQEVVDEKTSEWFETAKITRYTDRL